MYTVIQNQNWLFKSNSHAENLVLILLTGGHCLLGTSISANTNLIQSIITTNVDMITSKF